MGQVSDTFYAKLCDRLSIADKHRDAAVDFFRLWQRQEGGDAEHNPFNTTYGEAGATNYNSVGVRNYPTEDEGVDATARTLLEGRPEYGYDAVIYALRDGNGAAAAQAVNHSRWGTHFSAEALREAGADDHDADDGGHAPQTTPQRPHGGHANVAALQAFMAHQGYAPANSQRHDGSFDGVSGPGTRAALEGLLRDRHATAALQAFLASEGHAPDNSHRADGTYDGVAGPGTAAALQAYLQS